MLDKWEVDSCRDTRKKLDQRLMLAEYEKRPSYKLFVFKIFVSHSWLEISYG